MDNEIEVDGSRTILGADGRILVFSVARFVEDICEGDRCFVCGASPDDADFNAEHVIPKWILRRYGLFDRSITLPNEETLRYGRYTVPCCRDCNSLLGREVEDKIAQLLHGTYDEVIARLGPGELKLIFVWLCLLFVKTHLKDGRLRWHRDPRKGVEKIGDIYEWRAFHHLFEVSRAPFTGAELLPEVIGSRCILPVNDPMSNEGFDLCDLSNGLTVAIRLGEIGIVAVLNDSGAASLMLQDKLAKIAGPLTCFQLREVAARMAVANQDLTSRPHFATMVAREPHERVALVAFRPARLTFDAFDAERLGSAMLFALGRYVGHLEVNGSREPEVVAAAIASGRVSFLLDGEGNFTGDGIKFQAA